MWDVETMMQEKQILSIFSQYPKREQQFYKDEDCYQPEKSLAETLTHTMPILHLYNTVHLTTNLDYSKIMGDSPRGGGGG